MLDQILYADRINVPNWNIHQVRGRHEPLVSLETWQAAQDRRLGTAKAPARKDRIVAPTGDSLVAAYEKRIRELEMQKAIAQEKIASCGAPRVSFGETYRTAFDFLANPWKPWRSEGLEDRRAVVKRVAIVQISSARFRSLFWHMSITRNRCQLSGDML